MNSALRPTITKLFTDRREKSRPAGPGRASPKRRMGNGSPRSAAGARPARSAVLVSGGAASLPSRTTRRALGWAARPPTRAHDRESASRSDRREDRERHVAGHSPRSEQRVQPSGAVAAVARLTTRRPGGHFGHQRRYYGSGCGDDDDRCRSGSACRRAAGPASRVSPPPAGAELLGRGSPLIWRQALSRVRPSGQDQRPRRCCRCMRVPFSRRRSGMLARAGRENPRAGRGARIRRVHTGWARGAQENASTG